MKKMCSADLFDFARVEGRAGVAGFGGGKMTSDAGALPLGATDRAIRLVERFAECFADSRLQPTRVADAIALQPILSV